MKKICKENTKILSNKIAAALCAVLITFTLSCKKGSPSKTAESGSTSVPAEQKENIKKEKPEVFNMIQIKGGWFTMGVKPEDNILDGYDPYYRAHRAYVSDFMMSSSEITQNMFENVMKENPSIHVGKYKPVEVKRAIDAYIFCNKLSKKEKLTPCYSVDGETDPDKWNSPYGHDSDEIKDFFSKLKCDFSADGYRLPTEAEWTYAAKGGEHQDKFKYSGSDDASAVAVIKIYLGDSPIEYDAPEDVKSKLPNSLGLYDMSGNVSEMVWDYYKCYPEFDTVNYTGPDHMQIFERGYSGIIKGKSFRDHTSSSDENTLDLRNNYYVTDEFDNYIGFRVARSIYTDSVKKDTDKAQKEAEKKHADVLKQSILSKLVRVTDITPNQEKEIKTDVSKLFVTSSPLTTNDILLANPDYIEDYTDDRIKLYAAVLYINSLSKACNLKPYYVLKYWSENNEYIEVTEEFLNENNLSCTRQRAVSDKAVDAEFDKIRIAKNKDADGFRFLTDDEAWSIEYLSNSYYPESSFSKEKRKYIKVKLKNSLYRDLESAELSDQQEMYKPDYRINLSNFLLCKNIPADEKELAAFEKEIAKYSQFERSKRLVKFEQLAGISMGDLMVNIKGGTALQSLDVNNQEFLEVTLGSFSMAKVPFTNKMLYALGGDLYFFDKAYHNENEYSKADQNTDLTWYEAAAVCNMLSELYNLKNAYTFTNSNVITDFTANGYRMPTEAEWEHAARSGTKDKSLKYGVYIDSVIYYGNTNFYTYQDDEWEGWYRPVGDTPVTVWSGKPNSLVIYNLAGYCTEWCNDSQFFDSYSFSNSKDSGDTTSYTKGTIDYLPYWTKTMPAGLVYSLERIIKGTDLYCTDTDSLKLSVRRSYRTNYSSALRLVRTTNTEEMAKLIAEQNKEHLEMLASHKSFFDENLKMISVQGKSFKEREERDGTEKERGETYNINDFMIADCEVTNEMFMRVMHYNPSIHHFHWPSYEGNNEYNDSNNAPAGNITLDAALHFCNELSRMYGLKPYYNVEERIIYEDSDGFRLPTWEEWLFAAMEGNPKYKKLYSGDDDPEKVAVFETHMLEEVRSKAPNKLGLYDMSGNINEMAMYKAWDEGSYWSWNFVCLCGGSERFGPDPIYDHSRENIVNSNESSINVGFRVVRSVKK